MTPQGQQLVAVLFVAGEAVSRAELCRLLQTDESGLEQALADAQAYLQESGLTLVHSDSGVELTTSPGVAEFLATAWGGAATELTRAAAETLALVAYCGPVTRFEIDSLRGVDSRRILRGLWRAGLVQRQRARQGRAALYSVSEEFLKGVGVTRREDLPRFQELAQHPDIQRMLGRQTI